MKKILISVVIPTFKPVSYLWVCLDSIYNQTLSKESFEVIIVLNGCCEPYDTQIKEWLSRHKDLRVQYSQIDQGGVSNARNIALNKAEGEYITFIDDDDYISPSFLQELLEKSSGKCVAISNTIAFNDETNNEFKNYVLARDFNKCFKKRNITIFDARRFFAGPVRKLIHRDIIGNRRFNMRYKNGEDTLFMFLISDQIKQISCTSKNAIYYRRVREDSANMHKRSFLMRLNNSLNLIKDYSCIWGLSPHKYSFVLYLSNVLGSLKTIIVG